MEVLYRDDPFPHQSLPQQFIFLDRKAMFRGEGKREQVVIIYVHDDFRPSSARFKDDPIVPRGESTEPATQTTQPLHRISRLEGDAYPAGCQRTLRLPPQIKKEPFPG
jgi:hypothetical protein